MPLTCFGIPIQKCLGKNQKIKIWENKTQKLLGVEIDRTLNFYEYITLTNMLESWKKYLF